MKIVIILVAVVVTVSQGFFFRERSSSDDVFGDVFSISKLRTVGIEKRQNHYFTVQMLFRFADNNGDGKLSASELAQYTKPKDGRTKLEQARLTVQTVDTDGDNKISRTELLTYLQNNS